MPSILSHIFGRPKRTRLNNGQRDEKTFRLYRAACRLLAQRDHEQIPVAHFVAAVEMSVGAFYERFVNKDAFLGIVVALRLSGARERMQQKLDPDLWRRRSSAAVTRAISEEMMVDFHGAGAGVIRAALKRGHADRGKLEPLFRYRAALADRAVELLAYRANRIRNPGQAVRAAMQMAEATALDALLYGGGQLRPGSRRMAAYLSEMLLIMLGLSGRAPAEHPLAEDNDIEQEGSEDEMLEMPIEEVIALPVVEAPRAEKHNRQSQQEELVQMINPRQVNPAKEEDEEPAPKRRRYRPRI